jgi:hypothetical protein
VPRKLRPLSGCQTSKIILQITSAFLYYRTCWTGFKNKVAGPTQLVPNWESGFPSTSNAIVILLRSEDGCPLRDAMLPGFALREDKEKAPPKRKLGRATLWIGTDWSAAQAVTPSFCRSLRNCSASFIWMTCIPSFAALSRFSGRSSIKQHSSGGRCVISRARR